MTRWCHQTQAGLQPSRVLILNQFCCYYGCRKQSPKQGCSTSSPYQYNVVGHPLLEKSPDTQQRFVSPGPSVPWRRALYAPIVDQEHEQHLSFETNEKILFQKSDSIQRKDSWLVRPEYKSTMRTRSLLRKLSKPTHFVVDISPVFRQEESPA